MNKKHEKSHFVISFEIDPMSKFEPIGWKNRKELILLHDLYRSFFY